ncbi:hypothetical protein NFI96_034359 [Prochilodus magdalenae]|nr:hypothetical protein NFI96_034359 [Prochilodus magdalenae]
MGSLLPLCLAVLLFMTDFKDLLWNVNVYEGVEVNQSVIGVPSLTLGAVERTCGQGTLFPAGPAAVQHAVTSDGSNTLIQLSQTLNYFGRTYSQLYLSMDGYLSFQSFYYDTYVPMTNIDIIAPLWTDVDIYTRGNIYYEQATSGALLQTATNEMNMMFPGFTPSWVFVGTWEKVEFEPDTGEVTFQVVLVSDNAGHTFILMNYGPIPDDPEPWLAGLQNQENNNLTIQTSSTSDLSTVTNVGIPGRWVFQVSGAKFVPSVMFPIVPSAVHNAVISDGNSVLVQFDQTFTYFGRRYTQFYLSMDGYLSSQYFFTDGFSSYYLNNNMDIIAPLWTDVDTYTRGDISYEQATSGPLLQLATNAVNHHFPAANTSASWVLVATWDKVEFEPDNGEVTFQVVLISCEDSSSFILMNYGDMPVDPEPWMAGYLTANQTHQYTIQATSTSVLKTTTNVGKPGRWAFQVNDPVVLFPVLSSAVHHFLTYDAQVQLIQLDQTFTYFGRPYTQLYLSMDGYLSSQYLSTDGYNYYYQYYNNMDIIAPLWTDVDTYTRGDISYEQATSGPLLQLATNAVNHHFPAANTSASWVLVATWDKAEFEPDNGEVTFQVVLISCEDGSSFILMNYGDMPVDPDSWMAGYVTADHAHQYTIQATSTSVLKTTTNVGKPGRWAFKVNDPVLLFPVLSSAVHHSLTYDAQVRLIQLDQTFFYFGRPYTQLYLSMDGYLSSQYLSTDGYNYYYQYYNNMDIIAPLWTDVDTYTRGDISYEQATSGPLLQLATNAVNHHFPAANTSASWVLVATWDKAEFEPDNGEVTFQVVLISCEDGSSFILMNYGDMPVDPGSWMAGYVTADHAHQYTIQATSTSVLKTTTNVGRPGRWAFQVNDPVLLFPRLSSAVHHSLTYDAQVQLIQLDQPFFYFGRPYTQLYLSMDGYLSSQYLSTDGYYYYYQYYNNMDIIAPLWTDVDTYTRGDISYEQATSGPLLQLATNAVNHHFPAANTSASWVLVATWDKAEFEPDNGEVTFQVVLISCEDSSSFILMNYGDMPVDPGSWMAGYVTADHAHQYTIQATSTSVLKTTTNVGMPGRWAFQVNERVLLFPRLSSAVHHSLTYDAQVRLIQLDQPFYYFGKRYTHFYLSMDGYLSSQYLSTDGYNYYYQYYNNMDIIAPLWTDVDTYTRGDISYEQATSGPLIYLATQAIHHHFPAANTSASWVLVATWDKAEFEPDNGEVTFQVVLISADDGSSFILMNYGDMPADPESWMAGYVTADHSHQYTIQAASTSVLKTTTNVGMPGRWAFRVNDGIQLFYPVLPGAVQHAVTGDGNARLISLAQPFSYFGRDYSQLYLSMDGFLSFESIYSDGYDWYSSLNKDIIAPLWTDVDSYNRGNITYEEATSGPLLDQATMDINRFFPDVNITVSWVFVATWEKMEFEPDVGEVTFQVVLISDEDYDVSFILMNYGHIPDDPMSWKAGLLTKDSAHNFDIQVPRTSLLPTTSNVGRRGRWAFRVDACGTLNCSANEVCFARSGTYGCGCADDNPRNNSNNFDAVETCVGSARSVSLSRCQLFDAGFAAEVLHLNDPSCRGEMQEDRVVFHFNNDTCGTVLQTNQTHIIFENSIQAFSGAGSRSVVSRDSWLNVTFYCAYPLTQKISMPMRFQATAGVVSKNLPGAEGTYQIRMVPYTDATYTTPYSGNIILQVNTQIFVAVEVVGVDSQRFSTVLDSCWATPYDDINYYIHWDLVIKECPNPKDGTVQILQNGVSTSSHFSFRMFTFTGLTDSFFLHCQVHLCLLNGGECALPCDDDDGDADDRKVRRQRSLDFHDTASISMSF